MSEHIIVNWRDADDSLYRSVGQVVVHATRLEDATTIAVRHVLGIKKAAELAGGPSSCSLKKVDAAIPFIAGFDDQFKADFSATVGKAMCLLQWRNKIVHAVYRSRSFDGTQLGWKEVRNEDSREPVEWNREDVIGFVAESEGIADRMVHMAQRVSFRDVAQLSPEITAMPRDAFGSP
ncbi:MAG: hypothetical protein H7Y15_02990 [Pseudonocardia sp.]|nr:hypothetical protein [Pseudonocardia sp.]